LTNGTSYTFSSTATNAVGTSAASASSSPVTPSAPTPTTAPAATTAHAATTTPAAKLATTGANLDWLFVAGLLSVMAGFGFLAFSRHKRIWQGFEHD
jgi:LPXTG-motif cell wall-anchored protein